MNKRLENKVALITGAAQGIGLACAQRFTAEGAAVILADIQEQKGKEAAESLRRQGQHAYFVRTDVREKIELQELVSKAVEEFGSVDILLNNAGLAISKPFLEFDEESFDQTIDINLKAAFNLGQLAAQQMILQNRGGVILNMSSVGALLATPGLTGYVCSKGALNQLTRVMAIELAPYNIRVVGIGPGTIVTELAEKILLSSPETRHKILSRTPIGRLGKPEEVASVAAFLASEEASYITGQIIYPDGGRMALNYVVPVPEE